MGFILGILFSDPRHPLPEQDDHQGPHQQSRCGVCDLVAQVPFQGLL